MSTDDPRPRKVLHIDMDAFYASVEQRDNPELRGKPVAVGGSRERGVVAAASYEARVFGVRSAMASVTARRKCPDLIFVRPRFEVYKAISQQIRAILAEYTPLIEPLSLDEAYLDVTENLKTIPSATRIAEEIRARIHAETGLTASAGVSYCKFLAKLASDMDKPDGLFVIRPSQAEAIVAALPVERFHGIGPATARRMYDLGIRTGADLRAQALPVLQKHFGKSGLFFHRISRGLDDRAVRPDRIRKSVGAEETFGTDLVELEALCAELRPLAEKVWRHCAAHGTRGRTVTLKVKFADFQQITRSRTLPLPVVSGEQLERLAIEILHGVVPVPKGVRLLGVTLSSLGEDGPPDTGQLSLALLDP